MRRERALARSWAVGALQMEVRVWWMRQMLWRVCVGIIGERRIELKWMKTEREKLMMERNKFFLRGMSVLGRIILEVRKWENFRLNKSMRSW